MNEAIPTTPLELITNSVLATKVVLAILLVLSLYSWGIMLAKWLEFRRTSRASLAFMREFARATRLEQAPLGGCARSSCAWRWRAKAGARSMNRRSPAGASLTRSEP